MKEVIFCSDLHGNEKKYMELANLKADHLIIGGDLFPRPRYFRDLYKTQKEFMNNFFRQFIEKESKKREISLMLGNDDVASLEPFILEWEKEGLIRYIHGKKFMIENIEIIGFKYIPPTPFSMKDFERRDRRPFKGMGSKRSVLFKNDGNFEVINFDKYLENNKSILELLEDLPTPEDFSRTIYVTHTPPYNCGLDVTPNKEIVGSLDLRNFIEIYQPAMILCGHVHECNGITKIGKTIVINPGQDTDKLSFVKLKISGSKIEYYL